LIKALREILRAFFCDIPLKNFGSGR